jgi:DhnA family fructose-bisphosphate aldolase class Ia
MLAFDHGYFPGVTTGLKRIDLTIAPLSPEVDLLVSTRGALRTSIPPEVKKPVVLRCSGGNSILRDLSNEWWRSTSTTPSASVPAPWRRRSASALNTNTNRSATSSS